MRKNTVFIPLPLASEMRRLQFSKSSQSYLFICSNLEGFNNQTAKVLIDIGAYNSSESTPYSRLVQNSSVRKFTWIKS